MNSWRSCLSSFVLLLWLLALRVPAASPDRDEVVRYAAKSGERLWNRVAQDPPPGDVASRDLFTYALALCEAKQYPERLERLFEVAGRMQDRDPQNRGFGNFRWSWSHPAVQDFNAVDFCMQGGALLWRRHRETMTPRAREFLREILNFAVQGCRRHRVAPSYTNISSRMAGTILMAK